MVILLAVDLLIVTLLIDHVVDATVCLSVCLSVCMCGCVVSGNTLISINVVAVHRARLLLGWVSCLLTAKPSWYVPNHLGQLSLPSLRGR